MYSEDILVVRDTNNKSKCLSFDTQGSLAWSENPSNYLAFDNTEEAISYINSLDSAPQVEVATISIFHFLDGSLQANLVL